MGNCDSCSDSNKEKSPVTSTQNPPKENIQSNQKKIDNNPNYPTPKVIPKNNSSSKYGFDNNSTKVQTKINNNIITQSELLRMQKTYRDVFTMMESQKKTIGESGQAKIRKYYSQKYKKYVVEKVIRVNILTKENSANLEKSNKNNLIEEVKLLSNCNYPNVIKIYDIIEDPLTIVMEYCDKGNLRSILDKGFYLPPLYKIFLIYSICDGLGYIHSKGIIHGDLKCENILLSTEKKYYIGESYYPIPKLADFSLNQIRPNIIWEGTPGYIAPEIFNKNFTTKKTDIFALGLIIFEILSGLRPLSSDMNLAMKDLEGKIPPCTKEILRIAWERRIEELLPGINNAYYDAFYTIMIICIDDDPNKRPDILTLYLAVRKLYIILLESSKEKVYDESDIFKKGNLVDIYD